MIIETLTAFSAVKIVWESLEILHMVHVGHITGKASYKGGNAVKNAIQQYQLKWQDQKNPAQQLEREAKHSTIFRLLAMLPKLFRILIIRRKPI